jgi:hypothetical protein
MTNSAKHRTKHRVYNYTGQHKNGKFIKRLIRLEFDDLKSFYTYMLDRDNLGIFGITKTGLVIVSEKVKELIK